MPSKKPARVPAPRPKSLPKSERARALIDRHAARQLDVLRAAAPLLDEAVRDLLELVAQLGAVGVVQLDSAHAVTRARDTLRRIAAAQYGDSELQPSLPF